MSKRVANSRSKTKARNLTPRIGYYRKKNIERLEEYIEKAEITDPEMASKWLNAKALLRKAIPKSMLRRHQGR